MKKWLILFSILFFSQAIADDNVVNVYAWAYYVPNRVIQLFEKQTGITVRLTEYNSNSTLYAKLKADPHIGYDVIIPSSYFVTRMRLQGMLHRLNHSKLPNAKYFNPSLLNRHFDPGNQYSYPYLWGTTGIVINKKYYKKSQLENWKDFWRPKYKNELMLLNDVREVFGMALISLGYNGNDTNPQHVKQAYEKLRKLLPNIKLFNSNAEQNIYIDEDARVGMGWNGDIYSARRENDHLEFIYPKDGFMMWIDCVAIPKYAPHLNNAYKFLNFIMQPKIAALIASIDGYSTPNLQAWQYMPPDMRDSAILNPSKKTLQRGQLQIYIGSANNLYEKYWELLKLGS